MRAGVTGGFAVPGETDNSRSVIDFCVEGYKHKYTRVARGQYGVEVMSMLNLVLVKKDMLRYVQDVRAVRRLG